MDCGLDRKTVFITGGSNGIGRAAALAYAKEKGVRIALSYFKSKDSADELVKVIEAEGAQALAVYMDLADISSVEAAVAGVVSRFGGIDVLINNAVQWPSGRFGFDEGSIHEWESFFKANFLGTVRLCQLAVPHMKAANWGRIVLVSSDVAIDSMKGSGRYSSVKSALHGLKANLVTEYSAAGILTNVVLPSWTLTDRAKSAFPAAFHSVAAKAFPTGRVTSPEDVASLVVYLGSGANGHVNGENIKVTGACSLPLLTYLWDEARSAAAH